MKSILAIAALGAVAALGGGAGATAATDGRGACVVPRLFAVSPRTAEARIAAAGCALGGVAYERPRARVSLVTGQVPAPGAVLPRRTRVVILVS